MVYDKVMTTVYDKVMTMYLVLCTISSAPRKPPECTRFSTHKFIYDVFHFLILFFYK